MHTLPLRLPPGADLRDALGAAAAAQGGSAFVLAGIGSLQGAQLRLAGAVQPHALHGDLEILSLCGTLSPDGPHLHMSVADAQGRVWGGHVAPGCTVRTTAEVLLALLPGWCLAREMDAGTGYAELVVRPAPGAAEPGAAG
jgi:predicted DNA-binding protein with PD1-like motif